VKKKSSAMIVLFVIGCFMTIVLMILILVPFMQELLGVNIPVTENKTENVVPAPRPPERVPVTVYYVMEENSEKIGKVYIEVFPVGSDTTFYMEVPADTRVNLSEELYKSLQSYAPELPQFFKLANMAESFSEEYSLIGGNRILSEVVGISFTEYVRADETAMVQWLALLNGETTNAGFFNAYAMWLDKSSSSRTDEERWSYYESFHKVKHAVVEEAPGSRDKDGYLLSGKRSKERLEELIARYEIKEEQ